MGCRVGYAIYEPLGWDAGIIEPAEGKIDPSVAYDRLAGDFLAAGLWQGTGKIVVSRIDDTGAGPWVTIYTDPSGNLDKPWLVGAEELPQGQEYYVVAWRFRESTHLYLRSRDGGDTWQRREIVLNRDPNKPITGWFCAQPAVYQPVEEGVPRASCPCFHGLEGRATPVRCFFSTGLLAIRIAFTLSITTCASGRGCRRAT